MNNRLSLLVNRQFVTWDFISSKETSRLFPRENTHLLGSHTLKQKSKLMKYDLDVLVDHL